MAMAMVIDDLWRECALWLTRCTVIPSDHKANMPDSDVSILARTLRDGVILCHLVSYLDPASMELRDFHRKPHMAQFLCCQNIKLFLEVCKNSFGIRDGDLFEPTMLFDLTNFHRVLITLSKLSQSVKVQQLHPNLSGFTTQIAQTERSHSEEDIYKDLHTATNENAACNDNDDHMKEEVYHDLCSIQRSSRNQLATSTGSNIEQRDFVIKELVDTEANYLEVLNNLKNKFMVPMERQLPADDIRKIFPKIRELAEIHNQFLQQLKDAVSSVPSIKLSQVFLENREKFLIYGDYCSNLTGAIDTLRDICKNSPAANDLVQQCQKEHSGGRFHPLRDILSVPMQRILKYHLLLDKLVHETSPTHDDYRGLERAKEAMVDVAQYINEVKRDSEHLVIIQKVNESIIDLNLQNGNNLQQYGHLLLDGELNVKAHEDHKQKHRYAFIFEKLLILVKYSNSKIGEGQYSFRDAHDLNSYGIQMAHSRKTLGRDGRFKCQLLLAKKTKESAFTLYMKTEAERLKWYKAFLEAMENLEPAGCRNTDHQFELTTFDTTISCTHCSKFLKGLIHQGYKCRVCGIRVHKGCISSTGHCRPPSVGNPPPVCDRQLTAFNWFVGYMDRDTAFEKLENRKVGTYLLRVRPNGGFNQAETMYALSLKTDNKAIKHMKIFQKMENNTYRYYLSVRRQFKTVVELVSFYERNDLGENFVGLNQSLQWPFYEEIAVALYDFAPTMANQLLLVIGCQVIIISKEGDANGWWRGKTDNQVGFFPKEYVRNITEAAIEGPSTENCNNFDDSDEKSLT